MLCLIAVESYFLLQELQTRQSNDDGKGEKKRKESQGWKLLHAAVNISLFPPLFFFSALYYTDLESLLIVQLAVHLSLLQLRSEKLNLPLAGAQTLLALSALLFRQTNVFWVGLFPAGMTLVELFTKSQSGPTTLIASLETGFWLEGRPIPSIPCIEWCLAEHRLLSGLPGPVVNRT